MRLVEHNRIIVLQIAIPLRFRKQDAICHELNPRSCRAFFIKSDLIANQAAERLTQLFGYATRHTHRCNPPWLRHANQAHLIGINLLQHLSHHLRQLRGFSRSRFAHHHNHIVIAHRLHDLATTRHHRKLLRIMPIHRCQIMTHGVCIDRMSSNEKRNLQAILPNSKGVVS